MRHGWRMIDPNPPHGPLVEAGLIQAESNKLRQIAAGRHVLEVGSAYGGSAISMAHSAASVTCVDPLDEIDDAPEVFHANVVLHGVGAKITNVRESSFSALARFIEEGRHFDLAFVDGAHDCDAVWADLTNAMRLAPVLAIHDYQDYENPMVWGDEVGQVANPDVAPIVDFLFPEDEWDREIVGWLIVVSPK